MFLKSKGNLGAAGMGDGENIRKSSEKLTDCHLLHSHVDFYLVPIGQPTPMEIDHLRVEVD